MDTYLKLGDWNAVCQVCGFRFKGSELRKRWDGVRVCADDFETRHPSDFLRVPREDTSVPWTSPEADESFVEDDAIMTEVQFDILTEDPLVSLLIEDTSEEFIMTQDFDFFSTEDGYLMEQE
jgi:hypothetical protein